MGPDSLRQLSPSVDREALRAQRKAGSKRADGGVRHNRRLSPVQTRFYISYTPALSRSFRVSRPISPSQPGRTGIKLLPIYTLLHPRAFAEFFEWPIPYRPNSRDELGSICWWLSTSANCGPAVPSENKGPIPLRQLSPSDDREASRAQRQAGSKRANDGVRPDIRSSGRSTTDWHLAKCL